MKKIAIAMSVAALPFAAFAAPNDQPGAPSYTYVQGDYIPAGDADGTGHDYDGFGFEGSAAITSHVFVNGRYDRLDVDHSSEDVNRGSIGVGLNDFYDYGGPEGTGIGYYGQVSYERLELNDVRGGDDATGTGYGVDAGLRWMVDPRVEINPHVGYADFGNISGDGTNFGDADGMRYGVRTIGYLTDNVALSAEYVKTDYDIGYANQDFDNEVRVGARYAF